MVEAVWVGQVTQAPAMACAAGPGNVTERKEPRGIWGCTLTHKSQNSHPCGGNGEGLRLLEVGQRLRQGGSGCVDVLANNLLHGLVPHSRGRLRAGPASRKSGGYGIRHRGALPVDDCLRRGV